MNFVFRLVSTFLCIAFSLNWKCMNQQFCDRKCIVCIWGAILLSKCIRNHHEFSHSFYNRFNNIKCRVTCLTTTTAKPQYITKRWHDDDCGCGCDDDNDKKEMRKGVHFNFSNLFMPGQAFFFFFSRIEHRDELNCGAHCAMHAKHQHQQNFTLCCRCHFKGLILNWLFNDNYVPVLALLCCAVAVLQFVYNTQLEIANNGSGKPQWGNN